MGFREPGRWLQAGCGTTLGARAAGSLQRLLTGWQAAVLRDAGCVGAWLRGTAPACQAFLAKLARLLKRTDPPSRVSESPLLCVHEMAGMVSSRH